MKKEKCQRCKVEWELPDNHTKMVYCYICKGMFCIDCWFVQREEENKGVKK
jgi:hypothetical protein